MNSDNYTPSQTTSSAGRSAGTRQIDVNSIKILPGDAAPQQVIDALAVSIEKIGLQTPISIDAANNLITGRKRFLSVQQLGHPTIECFVIDDDHLGTLWGISENLHRYELSALDRAIKLHEWTTATQETGQLAQVKGGRGQHGGTANAARVLGIDRNELRRARIIAGSLTPDARAAIRQAGLADHQQLLLSVAGAPAHEQVAKVCAHLESVNAPSPRRSDDSEFNALARAWQKASPGVRSRFVAEIIGEHHQVSNYDQ